MNDRKRTARYGFAFIILAVLILITLLLGRIYCSTICPMGIFQDIVTWISKKQQRKRNVSATRLPGIYCAGEYWV